MVFQNCYKSWLDRGRRLGAFFGRSCQYRCVRIADKVRVRLARQPSGKRRSWRARRRTSAQSDISTIGLGCQRHRVRTYQFYPQPSLWSTRVPLGNLCFTKSLRDLRIRHRVLRLLQMPQSKRMTSHRGPNILIKKWLHRMFSTIKTWPSSLRQTWHPFSNGAVLSPVISICPMVRTILRFVRGELIHWDGVKQLCGAWLRLLLVSGNRILVFQLTNLSISLWDSSGSQKTCTSFFVGIQYGFLRWFQVSS